jgi:hypothetical protein
MPEYGLAVCVPDDGRVIAGIRKSGRLSLYGQPHKLEKSGAVVTLVQVDGTVVLIARAGALVGPTRVRLVNGKWRDNGYKLKLTKISSGAGRPLGTQWYAIGQMRYFDPEGWTATVVGPLLQAKKKEHLNGNGGVPKQLSRVPFSGGVPGLPKDDPESKLVWEYVQWLRADAEFWQYNYPGRLRCDLFDTTRWRLLEAKVLSDRFTLRAAVGQLLDYKRFHPRSPSLGVLVGSKPSRSCIRYLADCKVTAVWQTRAGWFRDSTEGRAWSSARRRPRG